MRDLVDCCPEAESDSGEDRQKAQAKGCSVYVGNNLLIEFDERSDDYAYTNARDYAKKWNEREGRDNQGNQSPTISQRFKTIR